MIRRIRLTAVVAASFAGFALAVVTGALLSMPEDWLALVGLLTYLPLLFGVVLWWALITAPLTGVLLQIMAGLGWCARTFAIQVIGGAVSGGVHAIAAQVYFSSASWQAVDKSMGIGAVPSLSVGALVVGGLVGGATLWLFNDENNRVANWLYPGPDRPQSRYRRNTITTG